MSYGDTKHFVAKDAKLPRSLAEVVDKLYGYSLLLDVYLGVNNELAHCVRSKFKDVGPLLLQLEQHYVHNKDLALHTAVRAMFWIQQQIFYYFRLRKTMLPGETEPALPPMDQLIGVLHTKTFQGLLGDLPESWLKKEGVPGVPKALTGGSGGGRDNRGQGEGGGGNKVTNPRPDRDLVRRWEASGLTSVQQLLAKYSGEMPMVLPKFGGDEACLTYILKKE